MNKNNNQCYRLKIVSITILQLFCLTTSFATPLIYNSSNYQLTMKFDYNPIKHNYVTDYALTDHNHLILNKGKLRGCTYGGNIQDLATYLTSQMQLIKITPIKNGFAIHYVIACGAQTVWRLDVITPACIASVPATSDDGKYIAIGDNANRIMFGYLKGFGASREVIKTELILGEKNKIEVGDKKFSKMFKNEVRIICH